MVYNRKGEVGSPPTREDRIFKKAEYWYYRTREGVAIGPFDSHLNAEKGVKAYIDCLLETPEIVTTLELYAEESLA